MNGMSDTTTIGTWEEDGTTLDAVEHAIADLRRRETRAAVRMAVLTLVVLVERHECTAALDTIREMARTHPSHAIAIVAGDARSRPHLRAEVRVHTIERDERAFCFEDVTLEVDGPAVAHLDSIVGPLALPDLPVAVWIPGRAPALGEPLLAAADRVVVDAKRIGDAAAFPDLLALARRFPVVDLSWVRLEPWRDLLAGLFEGDPFRPFVHGIDAVAVEGKEGPRHLMAGWLLSRLGLPARAATLRAAEHVSIELTGTHDGRRGRFAVRRTHGTREIDASAAIEGGPSYERTLRLRERSDARVLAHALARLGHDTVWEAAVASAVDLAV